MYCRIEFLSQFPPAQRLIADDSRGGFTRLKICQNAYGMYRQPSHRLSLDVGCNHHGRVKKNESSPSSIYADRALSEEPCRYLKQKLQNETRGSRNNRMEGMSPSAVVKFGVKREAEVQPRWQLSNYTRKSRRARFKRVVLKTSVEGQECSHSRVPYTHPQATDSRSSSRYFRGQRWVAVGRCADGLLMKTCLRALVYIYTCVLKSVVPPNDQSLPGRHRSPPRNNPPPLSPTPSHISERVSPT